MNVWRKIDRLINGQFISTFTHKDATKEKTILSNTLDSVSGGAKKDYKPWKKVRSTNGIRRNQNIVSFHLGCRTKQKSSAYKQYCSGTDGGCPSHDTVINVEMQILK